MWAAFETLIFSALFFVFFCLIFLAPGFCLLRWLGLRFEPWLEVLCGLGLGLLLGPALLVLGLFCSLPRIAVQLSLLLFFSTSIAWAWRLGLARVLRAGPLPRGFGLFFLFYLLSVFTSAFPGGRMGDVEMGRIMEMTGLANDHLIPYNVSRYALEGLDPKNLEVVPSWSAAERGPLAGLVNAAVFFVFGFQENGHWLRPSTGLFFVYQALMTFLNALAVFALYLLSASLVSWRAAGYTAVFLSSCYFVVLNMYFAWPKFFACFWLLAAVAVFLCTRLSWLAALFFAASYLSHSFAAFYIAPMMFIFLFFRGGLPYLKNIVSTASLGLFALLFVSPWFFVKSKLLGSANRLLYLHIFCFQGAALDGISPSQMLKQYLTENSWGEILQIRLSNLFYPFKIDYVFQELWVNWSSPLLVIRGFSHMAFYQLVPALGVVSFLLILLFPLVARKNKLHAVVYLLVASSFGALMLASLVFGCPERTWNHVWAYMGVLTLTLIFGVVLDSKPWFGLPFFALGIGTNAVVFVMNVYLASSGKGVYHVSSAYLFWQLVVFSSLYGFCWSLVLSKAAND